MKKRDSKVHEIPINLTDIERQQIKRLAKARGKTIDQVATELFKAGVAAQRQAGQ